MSLHHRVHTLYDTPTPSWSLAWCRASYCVLPKLTSSSWLICAITSHHWHSPEIILLLMKLSSAFRNSPGPSIEIPRWCGSNDRTWPANSYYTRARPQISPSFLWSNPPHKVLFKSLEQPTQDSKNSVLNITLQTTNIRHDYSSLVKLTKFWCCLWWNVTKHFVTVTKLISE